MKGPKMSEQVKDKLKISIQNELTINYATEIYKLFADGLQSDGDLLIVIDSPIPVDVTFLQILHAFLAKCKSQNKKVFFEINGLSEFNEALMRMGYYNFAKILGSASEVVEG